MRLLAVVQGIVIGVFPLLLSPFDSSRNFPLLASPPTRRCSAMRILANHFLLPSPAVVVDSSGLFTISILLWFCTLPLDYFPPGIFPKLKLDGSFFRAGLLPIKFDAFPLPLPGSSPTFWPSLWTCEGCWMGGLTWGPFTTPPLWKIFQCSLMLFG